MTERVRRAVYRDQSGQRRHRPDYWLVIISLVLLILGLVVIYSISPGLAAQRDVGENYYVAKQLIAIGLGIVAFVAMANIPLSFWRRMQRPLIILAGLSVIAVMALGQEINGAQRWLQIGGLSFQAVELIKFALLIWLAGLLADGKRDGTLADEQKTLKPILIAIAVIGVTVAFIQSDLGSTGVMMAMIGMMAFVSGLPLKRIALFGGIIVIGTILAVSTSAYRRDRLMTFLNPASDCQDEGYQACQALIAVGSGGMFGLGLARSVQAYGYLPEAANDSIFAIFAEKFGFVGVAVLLGLFVVLFGRMKSIAERAPDEFSRLVVIGILAWLSTQAIINIGAMIGMLPLKGITLPLISYGGTSVLFVTGAVGLIFQISRYTTYSNLNTENTRIGHDTIAGRRGERRPYYSTSSRRS